LKATTKCKSRFGLRRCYKSSSNRLIFAGEVVSSLRKAWLRSADARGIAANTGKGQRHIAPASFKSRKSPQRRAVSRKSPQLQLWTCLGVARRFEAGTSRCCGGGRWANRNDKAAAGIASQDALLSSSMGTISLVRLVMAGRFNNSSSRSTSNRITLPSCKSCTCSMCLHSITRVSMSPSNPLCREYAPYCARMLPPIASRAQQNPNPICPKGFSKPSEIGPSACGCLLTDFRVALQAIQRLWRNGSNRKAGRELPTGRQLMPLGDR
jgi:hypothetical protein